MKVELTKAQNENTVYAINMYLDYIEHEEGINQVKNSLLKVLIKLGGERESC